MPSNFIHSYCLIRNGEINLNGTYVSIKTDDDNFLKNLYHHLNLDYPKFFKMDSLCKLGLLSTELLLSTLQIEFNKENLSMIISNASSTIDTDLKHQNTIQNPADFFPSPAIFVYTLPNILIGEICIKHKIKGENTFFITEKFNSNLLVNYTDILLKNLKNQHSISGWIEYTEHHFEAFLYIVSKEKSGLSISHTPDNLNQLYHSIR